MLKGKTGMTEGKIDAAIVAAGSTTIAGMTLADVNTVVVIAAGVAFIALTLARTVKVILEIYRGDS